MSKGTVSVGKPGGLTRLALKFPILLYRWHLGRLLGDRFLMLTHTGRVTQAPHQTVVEVVHHDKATDTYIIASGWGEHSDWYRNLQKTPDAIVQTGGRQFAAISRRLTRDQAAQALYQYAQRHPAAFRKLAKFMTGQKLTASLEDCRKVAQSVPLVELSLKAESK